MDYLNRLLVSVQRQSFRDFEVIIVDQSQNPSVIDIINQYTKSFQIIHLVQAESGASLARNAGGNLARGEILFWPDEDCLLSEINLLMLVDKEFKINPELDGLIVVARDEHGVPFHRWLPHQTRLLTPLDALTRATEWAMFIRREIFYFNVGFDCNFGPGKSTLWAAGELADLCLRMLYNRHRLVFTPEIYVNHPNPKIQSNNQIQLRKGFLYATGMGAVIRKNNLSSKLFLKYLAICLRAIGWNFLLLKTPDTKFHLYRLIGVIIGWRQYHKYNWHQQRNNKPHLP